LIIASRISFDIEVFAKAIVVAALISSMSALVIHFAFPQLIEQSFQASEDVIYISTEGGRMTWENSCLVFIVSAIFFAAPRRSVMIWLSLSVCVIALGATTSRTQLVSLAVFGILLNVLWTDSAIKRIKKMVISVIVVVAISLLIYFTFSHDSRFRQYVDIGLLGQGDMSNVYETSVEVNRLFLYEQYWDRIVNSFPYGQGLGHPVANNGVQDVYIADISIVAFLIPFGLTGVLLFIVFIKNIFKLIRNSYSDSYFKKHLRESFSVMIVIWIVISLNDDWISRKISVIYMAIISVLLFSGEHRRLVGPK
jgi:hypothetical protein